jgi:hypothetical protein
MNERLEPLTVGALDGLMAPERSLLAQALSPLNEFMRVTFLSSEIC